MCIISIFILMLLSGFCYSSREEFTSVQSVQDQNEVSPGSDVCLRCDVSLLSESSTLHWETDNEPTSNTTLIYNNSAYIILHTVDEHNTGQYYCRLTEDGKVQTVRNHTLNVKTHSYNRNIKTNKTIYRESSSKNEVSLICKSSRKYNSWRWTWEKRPNSQIDLITVEKEEVQVKGPIKPGRFSSTTYNSQAFTFHISPVLFNYSGTYRCITETTIYTTTILHTIRVSIGVLGNQSVLLTCELSEVTESVTLVWLRMERNRGLLEQQNMMTDKNNKLQLTVNLSSYQTQPLHWQCAVFTENQLRALAPVIISFTPGTTNTPTISTKVSTVSNQRSTDTLTAPNQDTEDSGLKMVIIVSCAVTVSVLILLALLVFKCLRNTVDAGPVIGLKSQDDDDNIHYASVTLAASNQGADACHASSEVLDKNGVVIYSAIKVQ
ncbi:uncharacterized protein LOC130235036 [Danio aesculapii]|uniref:uncharacterized protein LOC130235036 n=1 Tax=Danio aesculapii TaxID=1142201 RepID=UPI0024C0E45A|nr:uncharacterized protein LOC130235036 [Danio aesculapii]